MATPGSPSPSAVEAPAAPWPVAVLSFATWSLALALSRQIPAEVPSVAWLSNLVPMAAVFGLALGSILQERRALRWLFPVGLVLLLLFILASRGLVLPPGTGAVHPWLSRETLPHPAILIPDVPAAALLFAIVTLPFAALGQALARAMDHHPRLVASAWGLAGGLAGVVLFLLAALVGLPPWAWITGVAVLGAAAPTETREKRVALLAAGLLFLLSGRSPLPSQWSPYSLVQHRQTPGGLAVFLDSGVHEYAFDPTTHDGDDREFQTEVLARRQRPYEIFESAHGRRPETVLVLGAGSGNDVAVALDQGVLRVVAVEVDPVVLGLGRDLNLSEPYSDPRVEAVVDAPRSYLRSSRETFDLIVWDLPDLPEPRSATGDLPIESGAFTREALEEAKRRLAEGGILVAFSSVHDDRLFPRLQATLESAFGQRTSLVVDGPWLFNTTLLASRDLDSIRDTGTEARHQAGGPPSTDDWPYLSGKRLAVPPRALRLLGVATVLTIAVVTLAQRLQPVRDLYASNLLLGAGIALAVCAAAARLTLLFGSTWLLATASVSGGLVTALAAVVLVARGKAPPSTAAWAGLLAGLLLNYAIPVPLLVSLDVAGRTAAAAALVGLPAFGAALCFAHLVREEPVTGYPLGAWLVGAPVGVLLGHLSAATGMRAVWVMALGACALAWLAAATLRPRRVAKAAAR